MIQNLLEEHGIPCQIINKSDSVYPTLGESELYVDVTYQTEAFKLVETMQGSENELNDSNN